MAKVVFKQGNSTIVIPDSLNNTFQKVLDGMLPETKKQLITIVEDLEQEAKQKWLVRRTKSGRLSKESKNSKDRVYSEVIVDSNFALSGRLGNDADYAWAIRVGERSKSTIPQGRRLANELLFKPMKKESKKLIETLARESSKMITKG